MAGVPCARVGGVGLASGLGGRYGPPAMSSSRVALLLAPAGLFGGHSMLGAVGRVVDLEPHAAATSWVSPTVASVVLGMALLLLASVQPVGARRQWWSVLRWQLLLFGVVELVERHGSMAVVQEALHDPRWWLAVACQVAATALVVVLLQVGAYARARLVSVWTLLVWFVPAAPKRLLRGATPWLGLHDELCHGACVRRRRGPPSVGFLTV